jgi:hypothetical protein
MNTKLFMVISDILTQTKKYVIMIVFIKDMICEIIISVIGPSWSKSIRGQGRS